VVGNSGREYDSLKNGDRSLASFIWGRSTGLKSAKKPVDHSHEKYGGANFNFSKTAVTATFFEVGATVAKITITKANASPTDYLLLTSRKERPNKKALKLRNKLKAKRLN